MDLTVITPTWRRPKHLAMTLAAFARQSHRLCVEHLVISDGPDPEAWAVCRVAGYARDVQGTARSYAEILHVGDAGGTIRDVGAVAARGDYCIFWDDDNLYDDHALAAAYATAAGFDIGLVQAIHQGDLVRSDVRPFPTIPEAWEDRFLLGQVDTMCVCVRTDVARGVRWADQPTLCNDFRWLTRLHQAGATVHFAPVVIGTKL